MDNKILNVLNFYVLATSLKDKIRSGWLKWNISKERLESVAEHIYGTCILAIAIDSEFDEKIDLNKVLKMLVLHELEEVIIGDFTPFDKISDEEKLRIGAEAVSKILDGLVKKEEYENLLNEFNSHKTNEAIYAFCCDKLEADLQAKIYSQEGYTNIYDERNKILLNDDRIKKLITNGSKNLADLFIDYDISKLSIDTFKQIALYIKDNDFIK
ncbi:MAG: HD domain-containing protein [Bacilli bacterium]|nr:HD domain-containing protein [Bacilli bacterium]